MAVGSRDKGSDMAHNRAEIYLHSTSSWKTRASYPFHETIRAFEILAHSNSFIIFGGMYGTQSATGLYETDTIAKFNPVSDQWTKLGNLRTSRHGFGVIKVDTKYLVMGGSYDKSTETCELKNETIECTSRKPTLDDFYYYPALMIVPADYTDKV